MSTANKLTYLNATKQKLKEAINNLGGNIDNTTTFREYAQELQDIYDNLPKATGEGTSLSLTTLKGKMNIIPKGDTQQDTTTGYNLFNMNATPFYNSSGAAIPSVSGDTITIKQTGSGQWISCIYNLGDISNHLGEKINIDIPKITISASNKLYVGLGIVKQDGSDRQYLAQTVTPTSNNAVNLSATIPSETTRTYLALSLGANSDGTGSPNAYISYEKPCVYLGNTTKPYEKYTGGTASPNPSYPQNIEVVTGTQEVKVENAQLIDFSTLGNSNTTNSFNNDILTVSTTSGTYANAYKDITNLYKNNAGKVLRFDFSSITYDITPNVRIVGLRVTSNGTNSNITLVDNNKNITTHTIPNDVSNITQVVLTIYANNTNTAVTNTLTINKPILHFGSTATTYVEHQEQTQQVSLGDIELCKIGNYQDYLYKSGGKWYKKEQIKKVVLNGSENWTEQAQTGFARYGITNTNIINQASLVNTILNYSNYFTGITFNQRNTNVANTIYTICNEVTSQSAFWINTTETTSYSSLATFKTWLSTHNLEIYYVLATPNDIQITNETLIEQLNNLEKLKSYNGVTNINCSGNLSAILSVSALKGE